MVGNSADFLAYFSHQILVVSVFFSVFSKLYCITNCSLTLLNVVNTRCVQEAIDRLKPYDFFLIVYHVAKIPFTVYFSKLGLNF